ncbi:MAG: hypothetical protein WD847_00125 [Pirellulales bacterium]
MNPRQWAEIAVRYTRAVLHGEPSNYGVTGFTNGVLRRLGIGGTCVEGSRDAVDRFAPRQQQHNPNVDPRLQRITVSALVATARRCGNCGEYADVAFYYLSLLRCPFPLDHAGYSNPGDHAFIIVGRPSNGSASDTATWGQLTVVCDPWADQVVNANRYWQDMHAFPDRVYAPKVDYRLANPLPVLPGERVPRLV